MGKPIYHVYIYEQIYLHVRANMFTHVGKHIYTHEKMHSSSEINAFISGDKCMQNTSVLYLVTDRYCT